MDAVAVRHRAGRDYIPVNCSCGRSLRAKVEFAGGSIRCWDCRGEVRVPRLRRPPAVVGLIREGTRHAVEMREFWSILGGALAFSTCLAFGWFGAIPALLLIAVGLFQQGEGFRRAAGLEPIETPRTLSMERAFCLGTAFLCTLPWILATAGVSRVPTLGPVGYGLLFVGLLALPLVSLGVFLRDGEVNGFRAVGRTLVENQFGTVFALLVLPATLILFEALLTALTIYQGTYGYLVIDALPRPAGVTTFIDYTLFSEMDLHRVPLSRFMDVHLASLAAGGSLTLGLLSRGALSRPDFIDPLWVVSWSGGYSCLVFFYNTLFGLVMLTALAVQAKWLGLLSTLRSRGPIA